ncbi:hypothetical protein OsJ_18178 [Oryza sativa Japonica Group]|uniref:Uncharacterized protein n=1 Tax=Oryza sativa subsp. japonica TaxID=39947 RepID=B9FP22_ORYSJ|nr:hypothetical protein OsJ_18178 [Oryza sativa Japonica Group]
MAKPFDWPNVPTAWPNVERQTHWPNGGPHTTLCLRLLIRAQQRHRFGAAAADRDGAEDPPLALASPLHLDGVSSSSNNVVVIADFCRSCQFPLPPPPPSDPPARPPAASLVGVSSRSPRHRLRLSLVRAAATLSPLPPISVAANTFVRFAYLPAHRRHGGIDEGRSRRRFPPMSPAAAWIRLPPSSSSTANCRLLSHAVLERR